MKILFQGQPSAAISHFENLAECVGIACERVNPGIEGLAAVARDTACVFDVATLKNAVSEAEGSELVDLLEKSETNVLLLIFEGGEATDRFLKIMTRGAVRSVKSSGPYGRVNFSANACAFSHELAGFSFAREPEQSLSLELAAAAETILALDQAPAFVRVKIGRANVFVWATNAVFDMLRPMAAEREFELASDKYIPGIIFLRSAFGDRCWHNHDRGAGIVIDDPLLRRKYGCIHFPELLDSARRNGYHVTLAFIPWNYWRTRRKATQLFRDYSDCFDICAHGCDHTDSEFRHGTYEELLSRNFIASSRMVTHALRTGMESQPLMVCPKEQYSIAAIRAFADTRQFIALICTACMPRDLRVPELTGADLLLPAQDSFYGFPVFKRHYSNGMSTGVFAMALFLGKPAILVEHHEFFRDGPRAAEEFVREIATVRPDLKWRPLIQTVTRTHARRRISKRSWDIRFFTDIFHLEHKREEAIHYRFLRRIPGATAVQSVLVDGSQVPFARKDSFLTFEAQMTHARMLTINVVVAPAIARKAYSPGMKYQASVALRRGLSEFRDNVIARNRFVLSTSNRLFKGLKQRVR